MRRCILVFAWAMTVMGMRAANRETGFVPEMTVNSSNKTAMWIAATTIGTDMPSVGENSNQHAAAVAREGMTVTTGSAGTITGQVSGDVYTLTITQEGQVADAVADQGVRDILATMKTFKVVGGMMGNQDFAALSSVATETIDLGGTTVSPQVASLSMANSTTKYIIMPDGSDKALVNASTFASCTALEAAFAGVTPCSRTIARRSQRSRHTSRSPTAYAMRWDMSREYKSTRGNMSPAASRKQHCRAV
jgi:hypothetical protein